MKTPACASGWKSIGTDLVSSDRTTPVYLKTFVASEIKKWAEPIKSSGVAID